MILFVAATLKEMENFIKGSLSSDILTKEDTNQLFRGTGIDFLICGVGPLNAAINLERYLEKKKNVLHVVNIGIAGSYDLDNFPLGSVCVASHEVWPEYGVRTGSGFADPEKLGFPLYKKGTDVVWNRLRLEKSSFTREAGLNFDSGWHEGVSLTLAGVSSSPAEASELKTHFKADMENMEGFALAYCCHLRSVPFIEIRSISNLAGSRDKNEWDFKVAFKALRDVWSGLWGVQEQ